MKKQNKFLNLGLRELQNKHKALVKQFVLFKVSLDSSVITDSTGIDGLTRDIRSIQRQIAVVSSQDNAISGGE